MSHDPANFEPQEGPGAGAQALMRTMRMGFTMLGGLIALLIVLYLFSGMFYVEPNEEALIRRFGQIVGPPGQEAVKSGTWKWAFPKPIDEVIRIPVRQSRTIDSEQFWYKETSNVMANPNQQQAPPDGPLVPGDDGYLVTGDSNIIHARWTLSYQVDDALRWHTRFADPDAVIRKAFDNAILAETASRKVDDALYGGAEDLRLAVAERLTKRLQQLDVGAGVRVVTFEKRIPPRSIQASFNRVVEVEQEQSTEVNRAAKYKAETVQQAHGTAARRVAEAQAYRKRVVSSVEADVSYFKSLLPKYEEAPETMLLSLYTETLQDVLANTTRYVIHSRPGEQQEVRIHVGPEKNSPNTPDKPEATD